MLTPFETSSAALKEMAAQRGDETALIFPLSGGRRTFRQWDEQATQLAKALVDLGLRRGDHVALLAENRVEWPIVQLAVARAGLILVPLNTHYRREDLAFALRQSDSRAIILSRIFRSHNYLASVEALRPGLERLDFVIVLGEEGAAAHQSYDELLRHGAASSRALPTSHADDVAALLYTSGTTGFPKGALLTHHAMLANAFGAARRLGIRAGDRCTSIIPLFHCSGCIMNLLGGLQMGAALVGVPAFDPVDMFRIIESERCTSLSGVPTSYLAMLNHPRRKEFDLSSLRTGTCGGADADPAILARCAEEFPQPGLCQVYGQTESATLVACPEANDRHRFATVGLALPGYEMRITDPESGAVLAAGEIGQVEARGPMVMRGYYKNDQATRDTITADGWLKTGDLGRLQEDGRLVLAGGRLRDMIIRGGENIYPVEIENQLAAHPGIAESAVFAVPDPYYGEIVAAALRVNAELTTADIARFLSDRIAHFKIPAICYRVEAFPLTASGKVRKTELRDLAARAQLERLA